jgi:hypothetical protein
VTTRRGVVLVVAGISGLVLSLAPATTRPAAAPLKLRRDVASASLELDGPTALDGLSLPQIAEYRMAKVREHQDLGIFPGHYHPLRGESLFIYRPITPSGKWLGPTPYYVANPYVLIVATCPAHVTPLDMLCPGAEISYSNGRIDERRAGVAARCWLDRVFDSSYSNPPGSVRLVMVNAYDAGLRYAHVDRSRSANVLPNPSATNVVTGLYSQPSFYHLGRLGANNISPEDANGWLRLSRREAPSRIHVKLWRNKPALTVQPADVVYEIKILPP